MTVSTHILFIIAFVNSVIQNCCSVLSQELKKNKFAVGDRNVTVVFNCDTVFNAAHGFRGLQESSL